VYFLTTQFSKFFFLNTAVLRQEILIFLRIFPVNKIKGTGRRGRGYKLLLHKIKKMRRCWNLQDDTLDCASSRIRFGRGYGPVLKQAAKSVNTYLLPSGRPTPALVDLCARFFPTFLKYLTFYLIKNREGFSLPRKTSKHVTVEVFSAVRQKTPRSAVMCFVNWYLMTGLWGWFGLPDLKNEGNLFL
jgi:hypothetical protein